MAASVDVCTTRTLDMQDRRITTLELPPNASMERVEQPALVLVLDGACVIGDVRLSPGEWAAIGPQKSAAAGAEGCLLALVSLAADALTTAIIGDDGPLAWYEKYEASVRALSVDTERPLLAPWTGYWVSIPPERDGSAAMHVHHELLNIAVIAGAAGEIAGYLLAEVDDGVRAWELRGGDLVTVDNGVIHNLVAVPEHAPLRFFVFNDSPSDYSTSETSDYHNLCRVDVPRLPIQHHPPESALFRAHV